MAKIIVEGLVHKMKLVSGMEQVERLVGSTLGPNGVNGVLDKGFYSPIITNDGVSIATAFELSDDVERQGSDLIRDVAKKTNEMAGDGTTTSTVLSYAIVKEGMRYSDNPMTIKKSLDKAGAKVVDALKKISKPIKNKEQVRQIATIASESEEIGNIITDTIEAIGKDGIISVQESPFSEIQTKIVEGYEIEKGFVSPHMITKDNRAQYDNVHVLVIGDKLSTISEIFPFLQHISLTIKDLVIFCADIEGAVINNFIANKANGVFNTLIVKCHSQKNEVLEDIAIVTGATFVSREAGYKLEDLKENILGKAERITATKDKTVILNGKGSTKKKLRELKAELKTTTNDNDYDLIEKRMARLMGGIAVINVGAKTEPEMKYLYYKIEDAVNATKAALEEGIVEGGGMALYRIAQTLDKTNIGEKILRKALTAPLKRIVENGGMDYTDVIVNLPKGKGYNAENDSYVDMIKEGIIDPTKVERCCVENAVSFAGTFLTSGFTIALVKDINKVKEE